MKSIRGHGGSGAIYKSLLYEYMALSLYAAHGVNVPNVTFNIDDNGKHTLKMSNIEGVVLSTTIWPINKQIMLYPLNEVDNLTFIIEHYEEHLLSMALMLKVSRLVGDWDVFGDKLQNLILSNNILFKIDGDMAFQYNTEWAAYPLVNFLDSNYNTTEPIVLNTTSMKAVIEVFKNGFAIAHKLGSEAKLLVIYAMKHYFNKIHSGLSLDARNERSTEWLVAVGISTSDSKALVEMEFSFATFDDTYLFGVKSQISEKSFHILKNIMGEV
jgi:hypothetical protein